MILVINQLGPWAPKANFEIYLTGLKRDLVKSDLVTVALMMAVWRRHSADELLHYSDQGSQHTTDQLQQVCGTHGIECGMSRKGDFWHNAVIENFFSSMKLENIEQRTYKTSAEARAEVFDYIEHFFNPKRRYATLGYVSPIDYEKQTKLA